MQKDSSQGLSLVVHVNDDSATQYANPMGGKSKSDVAAVSKESQGQQVAHKETSGDFECKK